MWDLDDARIVGALCVSRPRALSQFIGERAGRDAYSLVGKLEKWMPGAYVV